MASMSRIQTRLASLALGLLALTACNDVKFSADTPVATPAPATPSVVGGGGTQTCVQPNIDSLKRLTKILFVVDSSGSNSEATSWPGIPGCDQGYPCIPATDPMKTFRTGVISDFLNRYRYKTNFNWGFITFAGQSASAYINSGGDQQPMFSLYPGDLTMALNTFDMRRDSGMTPYHPALALARQAILNDPDRSVSGKNPQYLVVMLTDGFPTDYLNQWNSFDQNALESDISSLLAAAPGEVTLSTIFYGQINIPQAISLLGRMATLGRGQFANVNDPNSGFRIDDVIPQTVAPCQ